MIDNIDRQIIDILVRNALLNSNTIAKMINTSPATVRRRTAQLIKDGVIRVVAMVYPEKAGFPVTVGIGMQIESESMETAGTKLAQHPNVNSVAFTSGTNNMSALTTFRTMTEFSEFMQTYIPQIKGLKVVETNIFIKTWKGPYVHSG